MIEKVVALIAFAGSAVTSYVLVYNHYMKKRYKENILRNITALIHWGNKMNKNEEKMKEDIKEEK